MRCEYHRHNGPGRCPICQRNLRSRIDEVKKKRRGGASPIDTLRQNQEALEREQQRLRELIGGYEDDQDKPGVTIGVDWATGKDRTAETTIMKAPTQQQLSDPEWWDENAPEGATHRSAKTGAWFQIINGSVWEWIDDGWMPKELIPRPAKPEPKGWDGEGLPPVGFECEVDINMIQISVVGSPSGWRWCEVLAHRDECAIVWVPSENLATKVCNRAAFRPIRTQAEREREELASLIEKHQMAAGSYCTSRSIAEVVRGAGWRKADA